MTDPTNEKPATYEYTLGVRDAYANVCALVKLTGTNNAVREIATILLKIDPNHCHAKAVVERNKYGYK